MRDKFSLPLTLSADLQLHLTIAVLRCRGIATCFISEAKNAPPVRANPNWLSAWELGARGGLPFPEGDCGSHWPAKLAVDWFSMPLGVACSVLGFRLAWQLRNGVRE